MRQFRHQLPPMAAEYVTGCSYDKRKLRHLLGRFHAWLQTEKVPTPEINTDHISSFLSLPWACELAESTKSLYDKHLYRYLKWLGDRNIIQRDNSREPTVTVLPDSAQSFLLEIQPTLRPKSWNGYKSFLGRWCRWTESKGIDTHELTREEVVEYCRTLHERGLAPATRCHYLVKLRTFLFHLADNGLLANQPRILVRPADFPKPPKLLPRALHPDVDAQLCERLAASNDIRCRGFLLMRNTGMRVGELCVLPHACLHDDHLGHHYLKVPLGKLNNERLVPVGDETFALVQAIQEQGRPGRKSLIENPRTKQPYQLGSYFTSLQTVRNGLENKDGSRITSHQLRHTYATELLNAGLGLASISQLLGHRSMNMTLRYATMNPNQLRRDYLVANAKARDRYGSIPEAPLNPTADAGPASSSVVADIARCVKRDAAGLSAECKAHAQRVARQLKNIGIRLRELGL